MLNKKDQKNFLVIFDKIKNEKELPTIIFESLCKIIPFVACEIIIKDKNDSLLLTWRDDKWYKGWHFPGGLMRVGETFKQRIGIVCLKELNVEVKSIKFLQVINNGYGDKRGYVISLIFLCTTNKKPEIGTFFKGMPIDIIDGHKNLWKIASKNLRQKN